jgi:hypothetical protein
MLGARMVKAAIRRSLARELWSSLKVKRDAIRYWGLTYPATITAIHWLDGQRLMVIRLRQDGVI